LTWVDVFLPLVVGLVPAILTYFTVRRQLKLERERLAIDAQVKKDEDARAAAKIEADRETASETALAQVTGGAVEVVSLLRNELDRLRTELDHAKDEIKELKANYKTTVEERNALAELVETTGRRNEELLSELDQARMTMDLLRTDIAQSNRKNRDLLRQNNLLLEIAERTIVT
jgi:chromosome segregation ATPase